MERIRKLVVPSTFGILLMGWVNGYITSRYIDMFDGRDLPWIIK